METEINEKVRKWWEENAIEGVELKVSDTAIGFVAGSHAYAIPTTEITDFDELNGYLRHKDFGGIFARRAVEEWLICIGASWNPAVIEVCKV